MSSHLHLLSDYDPNAIPSAAPFQFGIVVSAWHQDITSALWQGCYDTLLLHGALAENIHTVHVPGSFELPVAARMLATAKKIDAVICLGCVITGETRHNEYINQAVAQGLTQLGIATGKPFIFGLLTPDTPQQARDRAGGVLGNKGVEAAVTAIQMAQLKKDLGGEKQPIGFGKV